MFSFSFYVVVFTQCLVCQPTNQARLPETRQYQSSGCNLPQDQHREVLQHQTHIELSSPVPILGLDDLKARSCTSSDPLSKNHLIADCQHVLPPLRPRSPEGPSPTPPLHRPLTTGSYLITTLLAHDPEQLDKVARVSVTEQCHCGHRWIYPSA